MKYIIKNCPNYDNRIWQEPTCNINTTDCQNVSNCLLKRIVEKSKEVVQANHCNNCDGIGYDSNCQDTDCGTYQCMQILELLEIEEVDE